MLEAHIKNKYNANLPKLDEMKRYEAQLKSQKLYSTMDLNNVNPTLIQP